MFLIDDILKEVLIGIREMIVDNRTKSSDALKHGRVAIRELAKSLAEIQGLLERGVQMLKRTENDPKAFAKALAALVDEDVLYHACNESGVCKDLRVAEDELKLLSSAFGVKQRQQIIHLSQQISDHERDFVRAISEFLRHAKDFDILAARNKRQLDRPKVIRALEERIGTLTAINKQIEDVLEDFRDRDISFASGV